MLVEGAMLGAGNLEAHALRTTWRNLSVRRDLAVHGEPPGLVERSETHDGEFARVKSPLSHGFRKIAATHGARSVTDTEETQ